MEFFVDYSHLLPGHPKCGVPHGHTAKVVVEIYGRIREDGMIMDFKEMEEKCWRVLSEIDHKDLNKKFERPTSENIQTGFSRSSERISPCRGLRFTKAKENGAL